MEVMLAHPLLLGDGVHALHALLCQERLLPPLLYFQCQRLCSPLILHHILFGALPSPHFPAYPCSERHITPSGTQKIKAPRGSSVGHGCPGPAAAYACLYGVQVPCSFLGTASMRCVRSSADNYEETFGSSSSPQARVTFLAGLLLCMLWTLQLENSLLIFSQAMRCAEGHPDYSPVQLSLGEGHLVLHAPRLSLQLGHCVIPIPHSLQMLHCFSPSAN